MMYRDATLDELVTVYVRERATLDELVTVYVRNVYLLLMDLSCCLFIHRLTSYS